MANTLATLQATLPGLAPDAFAFLTVPAKDAMAANVEAVRLLTAEGAAGVYVSLAKDYLSVSAQLAAAGVDMTKVKFVDAVSRMYGIAPVPALEVIYVDGPLSVDDIIAGVQGSLKELPPGRRFVLLDSLTTVMLYNSIEATVDFGSTLRTMLKKAKAEGLVVVSYSDAMNEELLHRLESGGGEIVAL